MVEKELSLKVKLLIYVPALTYGHERLVLTDTLILWMKEARMRICLAGQLGSPEELRYLREVCGFLRSEAS